MAALVTAIHAAPLHDLNGKRIVFPVSLSLGSGVLEGGRVEPSHDDAYDIGVGDQLFRHWPAEGPVEVSS